LGRRPVPAGYVMSGSLLLFSPVVPAGGFNVEKSRSREVEKSKNQRVQEWETNSRPQGSGRSPEGGARLPRKSPPAANVGAHHGVPLRGGDVRIFIHSDGLQAHEHSPGNRAGTRHSRGSGNPSFSRPTMGPRFRGDDVDSYSLRWFKGAWNLLAISTPQLLDCKIEGTKRECL